MLSAGIKFTRVLLAAVLAASALASPVSAAQFNVKPIRIYLSKDTTSTVLTVENQAPQVLRLQIRAYAWTNDAHGNPVLVPSDDLIVFPTLVDVNPMERRSIRIGFTGAAAGKELSYRIALDELPSLESQIGRRKEAGLVVRTRITVPVFFSPLIAASKAEVDAPVLRRGTASATFTNLGNVHTIVAGADVIGRDARGTQLFDKHVNGWYVLAGQSWNISTNVPDCSRVKSVSITVDSDAGRFTRSADAVSGACK